MLPYLFLATDHVPRMSSNFQIMSHEYHLYSIFSSLNLCASSLVTRPF